MSKCYFGPPMSVRYQWSPAKIKAFILKKLLSDPRGFAATELAALVTADWTGDDVMAFRRVLNTLEQAGMLVMYNTPEVGHKYRISPEHWLKLVRKEQEEEAHGLADERP